MEVEAAAVPASQMARTHTPESLRQRQRDRLSPRGRTTKVHRSATNTQEVEAQSKNGVAFSPALRATRAAELLKKKLLPEGVRKENANARRAQREVEDVRNDIAPDGGSAGREGRQFTVANVGNNGKIYLR